MSDSYALITGASSGIGQACAYKLAENQFNLVLVARRQDRLQTICDDIRKKYAVQCHGVPCDITRKTAVNAFKETLDAKQISLDIIINNAGLALGLDPLQDGNEADWELMIDTNIKGLLHVTRAFLPDLIKRNRGHIINIGSIAGTGVYEKGAVYCATKHAVSAISQGLRLDLQGKNIKVSEILPGLVETEFSLVRYKGDQEKAKAPYQGMTPLTPGDIAEAVYYCMNQPPHVNINEILITPIAQAGISTVYREEKNRGF